MTWLDIRAQSGPALDVTEKGALAGIKTFLSLNYALLAMNGCDLDKLKNRTLII